MKYYYRKHVWEQINLILQEIYNLKTDYNINNKLKVLELYLKFAEEDASSLERSIDEYINKYNTKKIESSHL